jgi:hypothetical protein
MSVERFNLLHPPVTTQFATTVSMKDQSLGLIGLISWRLTMLFMESITMDKPLTFIEGFVILGLTLNPVQLGKVSNL